VVSASIVGVGSAVPPSVGQSEAWESFFSDHFGGSERASLVWEHVGIERRGAVAVPPEEDLRSWGTEARMQRFLAEALPLSRQALERALEASGIGPSELDLLTVVTCTGYGTPGLDIRLADEMGMPEATQRLHVGHMGCYAALPGLATVSDATSARGLTSAMVCVELTSLHVQEPTDDLEQAVAHALFSDAAGAVVLRPDAPGLEVVDLVARTDAGHADKMRWDVTDKGFRMGLSPKVPDVLAQHVREAVEDLLGRNGLAIGDVAAWAVHPGGPKIVDVVEERLGIDGQLEVSRDVLRENGNSSSATVLLILERVLADESLSPGDPVVAMAFGPGLTLYAALLVSS
jgi:alkylresorcinol/alkylpyrone synthase